MVYLLCLNQGKKYYCKTFKILYGMPASQETALYTSQLQPSAFFFLGKIIQYVIIINSDPAGQWNNTVFLPAEYHSLLIDSPADWYFSCLELEAVKQKIFFDFLKMLQGHMFSLWLVK